MGTNYYAFKDEEWRDFDDEDWIGDDGGIHLTKTSAGWIPSLQAHNNCICGCETAPYTSWKSFKNFVRSDSIIIVDEYGNEISADALTGKMLRFREQHEKTMANVDEHRCRGVSEGFALMEGLWS